VYYHVIVFVLQVLLPRFDYLRLLKPHIVGFEESVDGYGFGSPWERAVGQHGGVWKIICTQGSIIFLGPCGLNLGERG